MGTDNIHGDGPVAQLSFRIQMESRAYVDWVGREANAVFMHPATHGVLTLEIFTQASAPLDPERLITEVHGLRVLSCPLLAPGQLLMAHVDPEVLPHV